MRYFLDNCIMYVILNEELLNVNDVNDESLIFQVNHVHSVLVFGRRNGKNVSGFSEMIVEQGYGLSNVRRVGICGAQNVILLHQ